MVNYCDDTLVTAEGLRDPELKCPGHIAKFDDCVQEALYEILLDGGGELMTGDDEYQGTYTLINFPQDEAILVNPDNRDERHVLVPAGHYILQTSSGGFVYTLKYDSYTEAREAYETADDAYCRWEKGCEPGPAHDECDQWDECQVNNDNDER